MMVPDSLLRLATYAVIAVGVSLLVVSLLPWGPTDTATFTQAAITALIVAAALYYHAKYRQRPEP